MGVSFGSLTKILLGVGLGILAVSCLTVTVLFGQFANKTYSNLEKALMKTQKSNKKSSLDASIAITVLGCISAVAAIAALALSILLEGQTIILIIVGGVSALFAFGCIVAEGVFTKLQIEDDISNSGNVFDSSSDAQKYIAGAIEDLYNHAYQFLSKENSNIPTWTKVKNEILGTKSESNQIITYSNIWKGENLYESSEYITLGYRKISEPYYQSDYGYIVAKFSGLSEVIIASTKFTHKGKLVFKNRYCWLKNNNKDFSCKNLEVGKGDNEPVTISGRFYDKTDPYSAYRPIDLMVSEYVVTPQGYITKKKATEENIEVDYEVDDFPIAYKKLDPTKINDEELDDEYFGYENSDNEYKVNGKTLAKAYFKDVKKAYANPGKENNLYIVPKEPKDIKEAESMCDNGDDCIESTSLYTIYEEIENNYDDSNKGKIPPSVKKSQRNIQRSLLNSAAKLDYSRFDILYTIAIINLIIQIFGILFWAGGISLGLKSNGSGDKTASEGEA